MTRSGLAILLAVGMALLTIAVTLSVEQIAREQAGAAQVAGCLRQGARNVVVVNVWRAQAVANTIAADDRAQELTLRRARAGEASALLAGIARFDATTDHGLWRLASSPTDRSAIRRDGFSCAADFQPSGIIP